MTDARRLNDHARKTPGARKPRTSWVDGVIRAVDRSPISAGVLYTASLMSLVAVLSVLGWLGGLPFPTILPVYCLGALWAVFPLALIHHLDRVSVRAFEQLLPVCDIDETEAAGWSRALSGMPAVPTAVASLAGMAFIWLFYLANRPLFSPINYSSAQFVAGMGLLSFSFALLGALLYHTARQLRLVSLIYARTRRLDLFNLSPLYGFAALAARTAIAWVLALTLSLAFNPGLLHSQAALAAVAVQVALVLGTFTWPLVGIHQRIGRQKEEALAELGASLNRVIAELNDRSRSMNLTDVDPVTKMVAGLVAGREVLAKVPTWPWSPGTPVAVGSTLLLPVALFVVERLLAGLFGL
jgi:hypothetical protein